MIDVAAIHSHISILFGLQIPGVWVISSYGEDPLTGEILPPKIHPCTDVESAVATIAAWTCEQWRNVYISASTMHQAPQYGDRGNERDILFAGYLVADFDDANAADWIRRIPCQPSWVFETSPGRYQVGFAFDSPLPPSDAKPIARALKAFAGCDHGTGDISHVWRIPGTLNWPNIKKAQAGRPLEPSVVRVVRPYQGMRIPAGWMAGLMPSVAVTGTPGHAPLIDKPRPDWSGPEDDDELFVAMFQARHSAAVAFGVRCPVERLFPGDREALNEFFNGDESALDAALMQHLAFWTGSNPARMARMAQRTIWARPKWDREDYLPRTISKACSLQGDVYRKTPVSPVASVPPLTPADYSLTTEIAADEANQPLDAPFPIGRPIQAVDYPKFFEGVVHVNDREGLVWSNRHGRFLNTRSFQAAYGHRHFELSYPNLLKAEKPTDSAWEAIYRNQFWRLPVADSTAFRPEVAPGAIIHEEGHVLLNTWVPIVVDQTPGDVSLFLNHLVKLLPDENDRAIMLAYMAACAQYPGKKFQWAPIIQGAEGNGKTFLGSCVSHAVGLRYTHVPNASDISNKFNAWIDRRLFIVVEELYVADRREVIETLKPLITNERIEIQKKQVDQDTGDNRANFMIFTNHKDAMPKKRDDRRYSIFFTAQQNLQDIISAGMTSNNYFPKLWEWAKRGGGYAAVNHFLHNYPIPDHLNPATTCHRAPITSVTDEAIAESMSPAAREILDAVDQEPGLLGGWISAESAKRILSLRNIRFPANLDKILNELGFVRHPGLSDGRTNNPVMPDNKRTRLYVRENSEFLGLRGSAEIANAYSSTQARTIFQ